MLGAAIRPARCLAIAFGEGPIALDPHRANRSAGWSLLSAFYDPLVDLTPELAPEPALAASWAQLDATHWRFRLRAGVRFHDGTPLAARDVVASFRRARDHPASAVRHYVAGIRTVRAEADGAVAIETDRPIPDLLNRLAFVLVVPAALAPSEMIAAPVGTGPYRFAGRLEDGTVLGKAWAGWRGRPACRTVRFEFRGTGAAAVRRLLSGEVDVCHLVPDDAAADVARTPGLRLESQPRLAVQLLSVDLAIAEGATRRALADPRVRRALLLALDRRAWIADLFHDNGLVASQYVHPAVFGYDPTIQPAPFDPAEARRLLAQAGFPDGFAAALGYEAGSAEVAGAIAHDLAAVGVRVELRPGLKRAPLLYCSWGCTTGDASDFLDSMIRAGGYPRSAANVGFADPALEAVLDAADRETDREKRLALLQQAQRRALDALPILPLTIRGGSSGVSDRVDVVTRYDERECPAAFRWRS